MCGWLGSASLLVDGYCARQAWQIHHGWLGRRQALGVALVVAVAVRARVYARASVKGLVLLYCEECGEGGLDGGSDILQGG